MQFGHSMRTLIAIFLTQFHLQLAGNQLGTEHADRGCVTCLIKMRLILVGIVIKMVRIENVILKQAPNTMSFNKSKKRTSRCNGDGKEPIFHFEYH